jgi:hypothetical protein
LEELRNTPLELVKKESTKFRNQISKFRNGSFLLVYTRRQNSGIFFWSSEIEQNSPHTQEVCAFMS